MNAAAGKAHAAHLAACCIEALFSARCGHRRVGRHPAGCPQRCSLVL